MQQRRRCLVHSVRLLGWHCIIIATTASELRHRRYTASSLAITNNIAILHIFHNSKYGSPLAGYMRIQRSLIREISLLNQTTHSALLTPFKRHLCAPGTWFCTASHAADIDSLVNGHFIAPTNHTTLKWTARPLHLDLFIFQTKKCIKSSNYTILQGILCCISSYPLWQTNAF